MPSQIQDQLSQQTSPVQPQSQNGLQPTSPASQAPDGTTATSGALSQEQLTAPNLRVGNSSTVVTNSTRPSVQTTLPTAPTHPYGLLWLIVPLLLVALVFWPKRPTAPVTEVVDEFTPPQPQPVSPSPKKRKKSTKRKKAKH